MIDRTPPTILNTDRQKKPTKNGVRYIYANQMKYKMFAELKRSEISKITPLSKTQEISTPKRHIDNISTLS